MHFEEFAEGNSYLHRMDPRVKLISGALLTVALAISYNVRGVLAGLCFSVALMVTSRLDGKKVMARFAVVNLFFLFLLLILPLTVPGSPLFLIGPLSFTREGLFSAVLIALKGNAIYGAMIALLGTSSIVQLGHALHHLRVPGKIVQLFFFTYRYISVLHEESERIRRALKVRCFRGKTNLHSYRTYAYVIGMLFVHSFERAHRIYRAMLCRGFEGKFRTIDHFVLGRFDVIFLMVQIFVVLVIITVQVLS